MQVKYKLMVGLWAVLFTYFYTLPTRAMDMDPAQNYNIAPDVTPQPPAEPPSDPNTVKTADELAQWFMYNQEAGGTVSLAADLIWDRSHRITRPLSQVTILTGEHTIRIQPGAQWDVRAPLVFRGGGTIFYIEEGGTLSLYAENEIHATGDGATAILTEGPHGVVSDHGQVFAYGTGATAIRSQSDLTLSILSAMATGIDAIAVACEGDADLTYCRLIAEGEGARTVAATGGVTLDACYAMPEITGAASFSRSAVVSLSPLYTETGGKPYEPSLRFTICRLLSDSRPPLSVRIPLTLDVNGIGTEVEVQYALPVHFAPRFPEIDIGLPKAYTVPLYVLDPERPRLISADVQNGELRLSLYRPIPKETVTTVYVSTDDGATWVLQLTKEGSVSSYVPTGFRLEPGNKALFYLELSRDGKTQRSNLLTVSYTETGELLCPPDNGDYDGGDMEDDSSPTPPLDRPGKQTSESSRHPSHGAEPSAGKSLPALPLFPSISITDTEAEETAPRSPPQNAAPPLKPAEPFGAPVITPAFLPGVETQFPIRSAETLPTLEQTDELSPSTGANAPRGEPELSPVEMPPSHAAGSHSAVFYAAAAICVLLFGISIVIGRLIYKRRFLGIGKALLVFFCVSTVLSGVLFFLVKFGLDSKYASQPQASQGVLNAALIPQEQSLTFLWDGWEFYEDNLTPEALHTGEHIPSYIYIGQFGEYYWSGSFPGGGATYRLTIETPDDGQTYALEIPHVFGTYRLWINGALYSSDTDKRPYLLVEPKNDRIELVIAVESYDQLYNGLVYPPTLGTPEAVWTLLQLRSVLTVLACGCAVFLALLSLLIGLKARKARRAFFFALLCICYVGTVMRVPLLTLGVPAESLLVFCRVCYYGIFLSTMLILNDLYAVKQEVMCATFFLGASMCLFVLWFQLWGVRGNMELFQLFSQTVTWYKFAVAAFLVGLSVFAVVRNRPYSIRLLFGVLFFAAALLADRIYPKYEPALSHWPVETAALLQIGIIAGVLISDTVRVYGDNILLHERDRITQALINAQTVQYTTLSRHLEDFARVRHDMRSLLIALQNRCQNGDYAGIDDLIQGSLGATAAPALTGNSLINAILSVLLGEAESERICVHTDLGPLPPKLHIADTDLCVLLSNLIRNAIEATSALPADQPRTIDLYLRYSWGDHMLNFSCKNPCRKKLRFTKGLPLSSKQSWGHGLGLKAVEELIQKYGGVLSLEQQNHVFIARFSI